jgi:predicted nucleotide-binding protein (sugar kinase/HSP70/actin superfamily)
MVSSPLSRNAKGQYILSIDTNKGDSSVRQIMREEMDTAKRSLSEPILSDATM